MSKSGWIIAALVAMLVLTNAWWAYRASDQGLTYTYAEASSRDNAMALTQVLAVLQASAKPNATRQTIIDAALRAAGDPFNRQSVFEKEGYVWVGKIGLAFDQGGKLQGAVRGWR